MAEEKDGPGAGHNSELSDEQSQALFLNTMEKIRAQEEKVASERGSLRALYKAAKADGFSKKSIEFAMDLTSDDEAVLERREEERRVAKWLGHPLGTQGALAFEEDRTPIAERAFEEGKIAGMAGKSCVSPHAPSTEAGQKWIEGWHAGQAILAAGIKKREPKEELIRQEAHKPAADEFADDIDTSDDDEWDAAAPETENA